LVDIQKPTFSNPFFECAWKTA